MCLLCTVDKVYEQLLTIQVNEYFYSILAPCLSASRKKIICETTMLRLNEEWKLAVDSISLCRAALYGHVESI